MAIGLTNANEVKAVQEWLNKNGFTDAEGNALAIDGRLGPRTRNAIKLAQQYLQSEGLYNGRVDGIVGQQTIDAMNEFTTTGGLEAVYNTADLGSFYTGNQKNHEVSIIGGPLVSGSELPIREKVNKAKEAIAGGGENSSVSKPSNTVEVERRTTTTRIPVNNNNPNNLSAKTLARIAGKGIDPALVTEGPNGEVIVHKTREQAAATVRKYSASPDQASRSRVNMSPLEQFVRWISGNTEEQVERRRHERRLAHEDPFEPRP